jgi:3-dehydroquinate dehydratase/shikimate dehydrogenase
MRSQLCETVVGRTMTELIAARDGVRHADLVELRLDGVADADVEGALGGRRLPAVVTCRPVWEGGQFDGPEHDRCRMLARALALGAEHVDVEWRALRGAHAQAFEALLARDPRRVLLSAHDFAGVPADLVDQVRDMRSAGAGSIKVAVMAARLSDTLCLRDIARDGTAVVVGMGEAGVPSRLLATRYGSTWTYAGNGVAPGQLPAERMVRELRFRQVTPGAALYGVVSTNALHSLSPAMHNAAYTAADVDAVYVPLRAASFDDFDTFARAIGLQGASITIPYKLDALRAAGRADDMTRAVGAANTLRSITAGWEATNTDVEGFLAPLEQAYPGVLEGARAAVLGAGGAARAVVAALESRGAHVTVHARRLAQASELASLGAAVGAWPVRAGSWDLLVNTTPLGGADRIDESPLPGGPFEGRLVYDLTYGARPSRLVREASAAGCATLDGLPMLVAQAERQFEWWLGKPPMAGVMAEAAASRVRPKTPDEGEQVLR